MSSSVATLEEYRQRLAGLDPDQVIGQILWFSFNRPRITVDEMREWFVNLGLDESYLPNPISPVDAFRNSTGEADMDYTLDDEHTCRLFFEENLSNNDLVERQITRSLRNRRTGIIKHEKVGEGVFYKPGKSKKKATSKGGEKVRFSVRDAAMHNSDERERVKAFINKVHDDYLLNCRFPTANAVRKTIRDYITDLNSIRVRNTGGVYFVHASRQATVDKLQAFVRRFDNGSILHTLPLVDTTEQREMLADSFQADVEAACAKLLEDVSTLNSRYSGNTVPAEKYAKANEAYQELQERAREYTDILQLGLGTAGTALDAALDAVMDLAQRIEPSQ